MYPNVVVKDGNDIMIISKVVTKMISDYGVSIRWLFIIHVHDDAFEL